MIVLENKKIKASVSPEMGMALMDFRIYDRNILNQELKDDFITFRKGLGPLIIPHFNQASAVTFENVSQNNEMLKIFPHIKYLRKMGISHPFQHGIGRYVAWNYKTKNNTIIGQISGNDKVNSISLKDLNGFDFKAKVVYELFQNYLNIELNVSGDMPVASGIHFYYDLVDEKSRISLNAYHEQNKIETISLNENHNDILTPIADENGFSHCFLETRRYNLLTKFMAKGSLDTAFESLIIFSNTDKKFVCIEPVSYTVGKKNTKLSHNGEIQLIPDVSI